MGDVSLLMPNRRGVQPSPQQSKLDMTAVLRGSRSSPEQSREEGNQANAH